MHSNEGMEDRFLTSLFERAEELPVQQGFTDAVMQGVQKQVARRRAVLLVATLFGAMVALGPIYQLSLMVASSLISFLQPWTDGVWLLERKELMGAIFIAALAPILAPILDD